MPRTFVTPGPPRADLTRAPQWRKLTGCRSTCDGARLLVVLMLVLAACQRDSGRQQRAQRGGKQPASERRGGGRPPTATQTSSDASRSPRAIRSIIGTELVITGANESLGLDSQYGAEVARTMRPEIAGHEVEFNHQDDGCSAEGGTAAARALVSEENIAAVIGTSCSSAGIPSAEILSAEGVMLVSPSNTAPSLTDAGAPISRSTRAPRITTRSRALAMATFVCEVLGLDHRGDHRRRLAVRRSAGRRLRPVLPDAVRRDDHGRGGNHRRRYGLLRRAREHRRRLAAVPLLPDLRRRGCTDHPAGEADRGSRGHAAGRCRRHPDPGLAGAAGPAAEGAVLSGPTSTSRATSTRTSSSRRTPKCPVRTLRSASSTLTRSTRTTCCRRDRGGLVRGGWDDLHPANRVADAFFATSGYEGVTGTLTCDENGDCADAKISVSEVQEVDGELAFVRIWPEE